MLGTNRASQYAGWWTGALSARATVNITTANSAAFPTTPRNYIDNPAVYGSSTTFLNYIAPTVSAAVDQTGITTNGKQCTWAMTIQYGTNYMTTAPSDSTQRGALFYDRFNISGTGYFPLMGAMVNNGVYQFNTQPATSGQNSVTFNNFNSLRNTWLGIVVSVSDTVTSFANWTGSTNTNYQRLVISDIATGAVLQQTDTAFSGTLLDRLLTNQYYYDPAYVATYNYQPFWYPQGVSPVDWTQYYISDFNLASHWINWGVALDPAVYYASLTGSAVNTTVAGQKAWFAWNSDNGTNTANGYSFDQPTGSRMPAGVKITSDSLGSGTAAQLVAF
jgi:hypothetical protein